MTPQEKITREKGFLLDCVAVGTLSSDSESYNPKLATGIPPYNGQKDKATYRYFEKPIVKKTLKKTGQDHNKGESMSGRQTDYFHSNGSMGQYLKSRNKSGAGYSTVQVAGHELFMSNPKPIVGYNGDTGFRRNTPHLRERPSVFQGPRKLIQ